MSAHDAHYGGNLVDGARMVQLFGDVATELLIAYDGDETVLAPYDGCVLVMPVPNNVKTGLTAVRLGRIEARPGA